MEITARMIELAGEALRHVKRRVRDDGSEYVGKGDDAPEWVSDLCYEAHDGMMPDDHRYEMILDALYAVHASCNGADIAEVATEMADSHVSVYNADRSAWLASHISRYAYCDQAADEGLVDSSSVFDRLGAGWYLEAEEVCHLVAGALEERANEEEE